VRGWQFTMTHQPLRLVEQPDPVAAPGEVVIAVEAAGLCHSDVAALDDPEWLTIVTARPVVLGHEIAGRVISVGEGVVSVRIGDRVGVCPSAPSRPGARRDGGYATMTTARAQDTVPIPDGLPASLAAVGTDAGMTAYHAVVCVGRVTTGATVGIIGLGGLGQFGAQIALLQGADVYAADTSDDARAAAAAMGLRGTASRITDLGVRFDAVIDFAGYGTTTQDALTAISRGGRIVQVGMGVLEASISTSTLIAKQASLIGSMGGSVDDIASVYDLMSRGELTPAIEMIRFEEIPDGLDRLRRGSVRGRLVAGMHAAALGRVIDGPESIAPEEGKQ